jgi:hypothetical protein
VVALPKEAAPSGRDDPARTGTDAR